jgi:hypothetical protein
VCNGVVEVCIRGKINVNGFFTEETILQTFLDLASKGDIEYEAEINNIEDEKEGDQSDVSNRSSGA